MSARLDSWQPFGLEAFGSEDRKYMTKSFTQDETLLPPGGGAASAEAGSADALVADAPAGTRRLLGDITKCLDLLGCDDAEAIARSTRLFTQSRDAVVVVEGEGRMMHPPPRREHDDCTVRVSNLADSVTEADLEKLFNRIGDVSRAFLVCSRETHLSRGFAFVSFRRREHAAEAIRKLNGQGHAGCVLTVEPATRRD